VYIFIRQTVQNCQNGLLIDRIRFVNTLAPGQGCGYASAGNAGGASFSHKADIGNDAVRHLDPYLNGIAPGAGEASKAVRIWNFPRVARMVGMIDSFLRIYFVRFIVAACFLTLSDGPCE
jgi:hypothetical protein